MANQKYPLYIEYKNDDFSSDKSHRYFLDLVVSRIEYDAVFIGINPSTTNKNGIDQSTLFLCDKARKKGWEKLCFCNLVSFVGTSTGSIPKQYKDKQQSFTPEMQKNIDTIRDMIDKSANIIVFWGDAAESIREDYRKKIYSILQHKRLLAFGFTKKDYPHHVSKTNTKRSQDFLSEYRLKSEMLKLEKL